MRAVALALMAAAALPGAGAAGGSPRADRASCANLGALSTYEVFAAGAIDVTNNQLLGAAAAAGNIRMSSYGVSAGLPADPARLDLIAGGNLDVSNAHSNGSVRYGGTLTGSITVPSGGSVARGPYPFSFAEEIERMQVLSSAWGALAGTEAKKPSGEVLALTGEAPGLNVFHVTSAILQGVRNTTISVPAGASALIDVSGPSYSSSLAGAYGAGNSAVPTIWNFTQATSVQIGGLNWYGTVLAPNAAVSAGNGQIYGAIWAHDWEGSGTVLHASPPSCLPPPAPPSIELTALCVDPATDQLAMRLRNTGDSDRAVAWNDEQSAQRGAFTAGGSTDTWFHVEEGSQPHTIVARSGSEVVRAQGTKQPCEGAIQVHKSLSGTGTPPGGAWTVRLSGTSGYSQTRQVSAGGTVAFTVPGTYEAGSAPIGSEAGGYVYTVTEDDPRGAVATVTPELVPVTDGQSTLVQLDNRYEPAAPGGEEGPPPVEVEPPPSLPGEPLLPPLVAAGAQEPAADLAIEEHLSRSRVPLHGEVQATVQIRNQGSLPAIDALASELPQANPLHPNSVVTVLSVSSSLAGSCTQVRPITCRLGTLQPGAEVVVHATVRTLVSGSLKSVVRVSSATPELNTTNNIAANGLLVLPPVASLAVTVKAPARSAAGVPFSYRVVASTRTGTAARFVRLCQRPPAGLLVGSAPGTFRRGVAICRDFGSIARGRSAGFTVHAIAAAATAGHTLALPAAAAAPGVEAARGRDSIAILAEGFTGKG